ncbi:uncharacterized protein PITG_19216 [Phytophthora infestans T30-4]|uniref:Reverse transcriptase Ty1/copia-type domain-containing protein n=1 Tax=Phytophthora infestans (strain T30-4) TaxID=403677 RepID=D0NZZ3_PHYIT|nr:uncharacterized protein PITG_19216 [Phytophthora infestans T30-4]EEY70150.1 conserved hypothetical protein [Phytophthora infestans T30-4]|eukprot:XP_002997084.1 conserved hypothetical protein [Phytophthora infestans T30-4]
MGAKHVPVNRVNVVKGEDPQNYKQTIKDPRADKWRQVIKEELDTLEQNGTPMWMQEYGVDHTFTLSAELELVSGRVILVVSRIWKVPARHGCVPSAYVKAKKEVELIIILLIPQGMEFTKEQLDAQGVTSKDKLVLILEKDSYGLNQSGRLCNHLLHSILVTLGFQQCYTDRFYTSRSR